VASTRRVHYWSDLVLFLAANNTTERASMVLRLLLFFLFFPSPLYAQTLQELQEKSYRACVQEDNPYSCASVILREELTPQQRDAVRRQLQRLWSDAISKQLNYLLEDGEGVSLYIGCPGCIKDAERLHNGCVESRNELFCKFVLVNDYFNFRATP
jgi:hypothetical protein